MNEEENSNIQIANSEDQLTTFVKEKYEELIQNKGIIIINVKDKERIRIIIKISKKFPNMTAFTIKDKNNTKLVFRYKSLEKNLNLKETISKGRKEYENGEFSKSLDTFLQLLSIGKPNSWLYGRIGLTYMKVYNYEKAIEFLIVATSLSKKENQPRNDFSPLIANLKKSLYV